MPQPTKTEAAYLKGLIRIPRAEPQFWLAFLQVTVQRADSRPEGGFGGAWVELGGRNPLAIRWLAGGLQVA
jgi:hypothetical protein